MRACHAGGVKEVPPHRQQVKAQVVQRLRERPVHPVRQLRGHAVHVLEAGAGQDDPPALPQQRQLRDMHMRMHSGAACTASQVQPGSVPRPGCGRGCSLTGELHAELTRTCTAGRSWPLGKLARMQATSA
jgi:hypothetical protein